MDTKFVGLTIAVVVLAIGVHGKGCNKRDGECSCPDDGAPQFCQWWSAKHDRVASMGSSCSSQAESGSVKKEELLEYIAYFRTHAKLEDPWMWGLFRNCTKWTAVHEAEMQENERDEAEIERALTSLAVAASQCSGELCPMDGVVGWAFHNASDLVNRHIEQEERLLVRWNLFGECSMDTRWTTLMEETDADARTMYSEFRRMDLSLGRTLRFVTSMVEDWPVGSELRRRTLQRMRQVRHEMPSTANTALGLDVLQQFDLQALKEYIRWLSFESKEGFEFDMRREAMLHTRLAWMLALHKPVWTLVPLVVSTVALSATRLRRVTSI